RVGEILAQDPKVDPDAVAVHFQRSGDPRAWEWLVRAGDRAQRVYAWLTASERLRAAAALLKGVEGEERTYCELVFRVAYLLRFSDPAASLHALDEVVHLANRASESALAAEVLHVMGIHRCYAGQFETGVAQMLASLELLEAMPVNAARTSAAIRSWFTEAMSATTKVDLSDDEQVVERLYSAGLDFRRCTYLWHLAAVGQPDNAVAIAERLVNTLSNVSGARGGVRIAIAFAYHGLGISFAAMGRPAEARQVWTQSREVFSVVNHYALIAFVLLHELQDVALTYGAAAPASRRRLAAEAEASLGRAGGALRPGVSPRLAWLGCLMLDGRWEEADQILRELPAPGNSYLRRPVTATIASLARYRGDAERAWTQITDLLPDGPATEPGNLIHQEGLFLQRLAVDLCLDAGDLLSAHSWLEAHDRWLAWSGSVLGSADGQLVWARWYQAKGEPARARPLATEALDLATAPDQPLVRLAVHRLLGKIETFASDYLAAEAHLTAALDLALACEVPFERALTLLSLAELRTATSESGAILPLVDEARGICLQLGAIPALARADGLLARIAVSEHGKSQFAGLTKREVEVLRLLVQRRTDKEIAETLFISPHTASTHVKHLLTKLGVDSRREAATIAADQGLI
nr:response regulator transcription factor [Sphingomonas sp.]